MQIHSATEYNKYMNILILDDDDSRHEAFRALYKNHHIVHAYHYGQFLESLLDGSPWDLIHLDHDLGELKDGDMYEDGWGHLRYYNGQHAALRICELSDDLLPSEVIIQSINTVGAPVMLEMLKKRGLKVSWKPFNDAWRNCCG